MKSILVEQRRIIVMGDASGDVVQLLILKCVAASLSLTYLSRVSIPNSPNDQFWSTARAM